MLEKVLMTTDTVGGVWQYSVELARELGKRGIRTAMATMGNSLSRRQIEDLKAVPSIEAFESGFKLEWMEDPWMNVKLAGEWLLRLRDYVRPDMVHLNGYSHGSLDWGVPAAVVAHSCVLSWWNALKGSDAPPEWDGYREKVEEGLNGADMVIAPSRSMLDALSENYRFGTPSMVIYNGRAEEEFRPRKKEDFIMTAGRLWDEAKNAAALSDIAPMLPWPVFAAGPLFNPQGMTVIDGSISQLGNLSRQELACWLGRASVFALPAYYEPFGLTALEAGLCGCALVLGDIPSLREIWDGAALFVGPRDRGALKSAVLDYVRDRELRETMGARARERARYFTPERMASAYIEAYGGLISGSNAKEGRHMRQPLEESL